MFAIALPQDGTQPEQPATGSIREIVSRSLDAFVTDVAEAIPALLAGLIFLILAAITVKVVVLVVEWFVRRLVPPEAEVYRQFLSTVVKVVLWFGVLLSFLTVVGLPEIAAALGTASGFLALGVSYALSGMIADTVAGIYLLRDPDFSPGDRITAGDTTGVIESIELRKTRIDVEGDTVVRANAEIEKRWTRHE